jgi:multisubunit Na+/H+ antiporter MnhF subunit
MNERIKNIDWLATFLYPLFVILMETFWVYPWLLWFGTLHGFSPTRPALSLAAVFIVISLAVLMVRYVIQPRWHFRVVQSFVVVAGLVIMLLTLGIDYRAGYTFLSAGWFTYIGGLFSVTFSHPSTIVIAVPALVYLWWRGINLGQSTSYFKSVYNSFILGLVALVFLIVFWQIGSVSGAFSKLGSNVGLDIIAFFFFGLMLHTCTRCAEPCRVRRRAFFLFGAGCPSC